jgi:predicted nucleotidyltransferase
MKNEDARKIARDFAKFIKRQHRKIVKEISLYGSVAKGKDEPEDIDIYIVVKDEIDLTSLYLTAQNYKSRYDGRIDYLVIPESKLKKVKKIHKLEPAIKL